MPLKNHRLKNVNINLIVPLEEPSSSLSKPPSNLKRSTEICINNTLIDINPENYRTIKELGHGAYGHVDLIEHQPSGIQLARKSIPVCWKVTDNDRLLRDMDVLSKAQGCPHIVKFYGALYWEAELWLFMEILDTSMDKFYKLAYQRVPKSDSNSEVIPEKVLGKVASSVVKALNYLYQMKVIHRDVKPSNILINRNGEVKLCDFGISGFLVNSVAKTFEAGCKPYMAPERLCPNQNGYDIRSDVWSLGLTLFEIGIGEFPYPTTDLFHQIKTIYEGEPPKFPENHYTPIFRNFISKCLEKNPQKRPNYVELLEHQFILEYQDSDISDFTKLVLDSQDPPPPQTETTENSNAGNDDASHPSNDNNMSEKNSQEVQEN